MLVVLDLGLVLGGVPLAAAGTAGFALDLDRAVPPSAFSAPAPPSEDFPETLPLLPDLPPPRLLPGGVGQPRAFPARLLDDVPALAVAPFEWQAADWRKLGLGVLAVGAVSLVDEPVDHWLDAHRSTGPSRLAQTIRPLGQEGGLALVGVAWLTGHFADRPELEAVGADGFEATLVAAGVITPLLKLAVGRLRPYQADEPRWAGSRGGSFPSGEATEAFAIASVVAAHSDRTWVKVTAWGLAGLVGLQRMELDAHYASDVVAGALIGATVGRWVVTKNRPELESGRRVSVMPMIGANSYGATMNISF